MGTRVWAAPATWFSTPQFQEIFLELQNEGKSQVEAFFFFKWWKHRAGGHSTAGTLLW